MKKLRKVIAIALSICLCSAMTLTSYADETYDEAPLADGVVGEEIATDSDATESDAIEDYGIATMSEAAIAPLFNSDYNDEYLSYYKPMSYYEPVLKSRPHWEGTYSKTFNIADLDSDLQNVIEYYNVDRNTDGILDFSELDYLTALTVLYNGYPESTLSLVPASGKSTPLSNAVPIWSWIENSISLMDDSRLGQIPLDISGMIYKMNGGSYATDNPISYDSDNDGLVDSYVIPRSTNATPEELLSNYKKLIDNKSYLYSLTSLERGTLDNGKLILNSFVVVSVQQGTPDEGYELTGEPPVFDASTHTITVKMPLGFPEINTYYENYPIANYVGNNIIIPERFDFKLSSGEINSSNCETGGFIGFANQYRGNEFGGNGTDDIISGIFYHPFSVLLTNVKKSIVVKAAYNQSHKFISGTAGKELPSAIVARTPSKVKGLADGTTVTPGTFDESDYTVDDGVWSWQSWDNESLTITGADVEFIGTWIFTKNPDPTPTPTPTTPSKPSSGGDDDDDDGGGGHTPTPTPNPNPTPNPTPNPSVTPDPVPPTEIPANPVPEKLTEKQWSDLVARTKDPNDPLFGMDPMQVALSNMYLNNGIPKTGEDPSHAWVYLLMSLSLMCAAYSVSKKKEA